MMKARGTWRGGEVLILGLSHANLDKLRADGLDGCIRVLGSEVGLPVDVVITAARTELELVEAFSAVLTPDAKVHISDRLKN